VRRVAEPALRLGDPDVAEQLEMPLGTVESWLAGQPSLFTTTAP